MNKIGSGFRPERNAIFEGQSLKSKGLMC